MERAFEDKRQPDGTDWSEFKRGWKAHAEWSEHCRKPRGFNDDCDLYGMCNEE